MRLGALGELHQHRRRPVRWGRFPRTVMDFTTWPGMFSSGVGIGTARRMVNRLLIIQQDQQRETTVFCAAAFGTTTLTPHGAPPATTTPRTTSTPTTGFV